MRAKHFVSKLLFVTSLLLCGYGKSLAVPAYPDSVLITQADGTTLWLNQKGDEFYNWVETTDGYVITKDSNNVYKYAVVQNGNFVPSTVRVHNVNERTIAENAFAKLQKENTVHCISENIQKSFSAQEKDVQTRLPVENQATKSASGVTGKRYVLTILMDFDDKPFTKTANDFRNLMNKSGYNEEGSAGSVRDYYLENSYGKLDVSAVVVGPFRASKKSSHYEWNKGDNSIHVRELVREAIHKASDEINFSSLDGDGDGHVDCVHIVVAGYDKSYNVESGLIWAHKSELSSAIIRNGKKAKRYIVTSELQTGSQIAPIGTICHELGHILGIPDFYDTKRLNGEAYHATGDWDVMGGGSWNNYGRCPAHHNPYVKCYMFQWGTPSTITSAIRTYTLSSSNVSPVFYRINTNTAGEYFLLENRAKLGFDKSLPNAGLLIYHIHRDLSNEMDESATINSSHPLKCYIVDAMGTCNPNGSTASYGTRGGYRAYPGRYSDKIFFTSTSTPKAVSWNGGTTGVDICFIKKTGNNISFSVNPTIVGPDVLCNEDTYSISGVPSSATISWTFSTNINYPLISPPISFPNGNNQANVLVSRGTYMGTTSLIADSDTNDSTMALTSVPINPVFEEIPYTGIVTLIATITSGGSSYTLSKQITLPVANKPALKDKYSNSIWYINTIRSFAEGQCTNVPNDQIEWRVTFPQENSPRTYTGRTIQLQPTATGTLSIRIINNCGINSTESSTYTYTIQRDIPAIGMVYPNPVVGNSLPVQIQETETTDTNLSRTTNVTKNNVTYTIELWHASLGKVLSYSTTEKSNNIDISSVPKDWYQLLLIIDGRVLYSGNIHIN